MVVFAAAVVIPKIAAAVVIPKTSITIIFVFVYHVKKSK